MLLILCFSLLVLIHILVGFMFLLIVTLSLKKILFVCLLRPLNNLVYRIKNTYTILTKYFGCPLACCSQKSSTWAHIDHCNKCLIGVYDLYK